MPRMMIHLKSTLTVFLLTKRLEQRLNPSVLGYCFVFKACSSKLSSFVKMNHLIFSCGYKIFHSYTCHSGPLTEKGISLFLPTMHSVNVDLLKPVNHQDLNSIIILPNNDLAIITTFSLSNIILLLFTF